LDQAAVACDPRLTAMLARAVQAKSPVHRMTSGAGHDAMIVAAIAPIGMLFLRSPGGISHHPAESVYAADVDAAFAAGMMFLNELERSHA
jgi:allantoate deiminase